MKKLLNELLLILGVASIIFGIIRIASHAPIGDATLAIVMGIVLLVGREFTAHFENLERKERAKGRLCRGCDQRKPEMALKYGKDEGLCKECLMDYLPYGLRK